MNNIKRTIQISTLITAILLEIACGGFTALLVTAKAVTAGSAPVLTRLEQRRVITHEQNLAIGQFLRDTSANLDQTNNEWTAAGSNRAGQVTAVENSVSREATLVAGLTNLPPDAQAIIADVNAIFQVIAAFYGVNMPASMRPAPGASMVGKPASAGDLEKQLKAKVDALKQRLQ